METIKTENTYGYKPLSYKLITLFRSGAPDFAAAEELIVESFSSFAPLW